MNPDPVYHRHARRTAPVARRIGTVRRADFRRNDDAYLRSRPEMVRIVNEAIRDVEEGRFTVGSIEELKARLERWKQGAT